MKPSDYKEYSQVFDLFSNPELFPPLGEFTEILYEAIGDRNIKVCDIGAGTGYFSKLLYEHCPNIELTLIEPSPDMRPIAEQRFTDTGVKILPLMIDTALTTLPPQDVFIFQRSLYALSGDINYYHDLAKRLYDKLKPQGVIGIFDFPEACDIDAFYQYIKEKSAHIGFDNDELTRKWPAMKAAQEQLNVGVESGEFLLFSGERILQVFSLPNYAMITQAEYYSFMQSI